ncbi:MAG: heme ABC transporter ATP-binding protein [Acidimicrobiia bacterium]|nr:heme ABC transporter ATP-binding protein [Acidimicrobiia bacterium]
MAAVTATAAGFTVGSAVLLNGVTVSAVPGQVLGLVGPNGAGKSTLLELMAGDRRPSTGSVELDGRAIHDFSAAELARLRAVLPQQTVVQFPFTARDVVMMGRHPHHADPDNSNERDHEQVAEAMAATDCAELAHRIFPSLSGGEQTRVALARIFAQQTPVILLDEPTATLDVHHQEHTMRLLQERARAGATVVVVLQDLNLGAAYADQLVLLAGGRVAAAGAPTEVLNADLLSATYRQTMRVVDHPHRDCPLVLVA